MTDKPQLCIACCNHWSYTGIGWTLGLESCVLSVVDAMEMADREPHVKTCINQDALAYALMAEKFPEVTARLKEYLRDGRVELVGGSYGQPHGTMYSGESNIRQIVFGKQAIRKALGYDVVTFLEQEEFSHPQLPQILTGAGYQYACLHQVDTWGRAGVPLVELNVFRWKGLDGTTIPTIPKTTLRKITGATVGSTTVDHVDRARLDELQRLGKPILFCWEEFGWEEPDKPAYLTKPTKYKRFAEEFAAEFVTLGGYVSRHGADACETRFLEMDAWHKLLAWGIGGDQLRVLDRRVEALLLAAERFDAIAGVSVVESKTELLESAWKDLLIAQSHDVALCEYTRWQGHRTAPLDRLEDFHNFTWGGIGYNHLVAAEKQGQAVLDASLQRIAPAGGQVVTVFNSLEWKRSGVAMTGRLHPLPLNTTSIQMKDRSGQIVPSQLLKSERDRQGNLIVADILFAANDVPSLGHDTYQLEFSSPSAAPVESDLRTRAESFELENNHLKIRLDPLTGAIASLMDKSTGRETLQSPWPVFTGRGDPEARPTKHIEPHTKENLEKFSQFDSSTSKAEVRWVEKGPVRATVMASHAWPLLKFETYVTLTAGQRWVEVTSRVLATIPPVLDERLAKGWPPFKADIEEGYWLSFQPAFEPLAVIRDYPLGIDTAARNYFHALTFADFVGQDLGLLVLHPGTQYFKRHPDGRVANLVMREWGSYWDGEFGWPRYAEYRHALLPHGAEYTNADRIRASAEFTQSLLSRVGQPQVGRHSFGKVTPASVRLAAFRRKTNGNIELRVVEVEGKSAQAEISLNLPIRSASETNLLGERIGGVSHDGGRLQFEIKPWQVRTFSLTDLR